MRQEITIHQEGARVHLVVGGRLVADMTSAAARQVADALKHLAGKAEEIEQQDRAIMDQAILIRAGVPVGLLHHPYLISRAATEAAWSSDLRRYMPGGVRSEEAFGVPIIRRSRAQRPHMMRRQRHG